LVLQDHKVKKATQVNQVNQGDQAMMVKEGNLGKTASLALRV